MSKTADFTQFIICGEYISGTSETNIESSQFELFPNPTQGTVQIKSREGLEIDQVTLLDLAGRILHTSKINSKTELSFDLNIAPGTYYIKLDTQIGSATKTLMIIE